MTTIDLTKDSAESRAALKLVPIATIDALREEAEAAGDKETVAACDRAAEGFFGHLYEDDRVAAMEKIRGILTAKGRAS